MKRKRASLTPLSRTPESRAREAFDKLVASGLVAKTHPSRNQLARLFDFDDEGASEPSLLEQWRDAISRITHSIPGEFADKVYRRELLFETNDVYASGDFRGTCSDREMEYQVWARVGDPSHPAVCTCAASHGKKPCVHAIGYLMDLEDQLDDPTSRLSKLIQQEDFTESDVDRGTFDVDPTVGLLNQLQLHLDPAHVSVDLQDAWLPKPKSQQTSRLAWRFVVESHGLIAYPVLQQQKKRGTGYTKGRKADLTTLDRDTDIALTRQDRHVVSELMRSDGNRYHYDYRSFDGLEVCKLLIGSEAVYLHDRPARVARGEPTIEVFRAEDPSHAAEAFRARFCIRPIDPDGKVVASNQPQRVIFDQENESVAVCEDDALLMTTSLEPLVAKVVPMIVQLKALTRDQAIGLLETLAPLRDFVTVTAPDDLYHVDGPPRVRPVVLARSHSDGSIDFAIRMRDPNGRLRFPGSGSALVLDKENKPSEPDAKTKAARKPATTKPKKGPKKQVSPDPSRSQQDTASAACLRPRSLPTEIAVSHHLAQKLSPSDFHLDGPNTACLKDTQPITGIDNVLEFLSTIQTLASEDTDGFNPCPQENASIEATEVMWEEASGKPLALLGSLAPANVRVEIKRKRDWFGLSGTAQIGETDVSLDKLLADLQSLGESDVQGDYVHLGDGRWAKIESKLRRRLQKLRDATHADRKTLKLDATSAPVIREAFADSEMQLEAIAKWHDAVARLEEAESFVPELPDGLDANLREYQVHGYQWLSRLAHWGVGGVLADDMGLGKTLQTLAVLLSRQDQGPALVIAPTSVGFNWQRETERFTPQLRCSLYRDADRDTLLKQVGPGDVVVCSYGLALRDQKALASVHWNTMVLDEAQAIKNSNSKTSKAVFQIPADWTVALTGTPVENHLGELWSLFHVVSPGVFGGWEDFRRRYAVPIEREDDLDAKKRLAARIQPFVLRRTKSKVLKELPPRTDQTIYVDLSKEEQASYENMRRAAIGELDDVVGLPKTQDQRFRVLALLTRLRQLSCHPGLVDKSYQGGSAKLAQLLETLSALKDEHHRALIFSQFTEHLALIRKALDGAGFTYQYLDGSTSAKERQKRVDAFQNGTDDAFLISLKAGGTGLNLTAADYVIHMDPWWNPAVEDQATDRAHRIGQDKPVMVYRIVSRGTIEEEILALHDTKRTLVGDVLDGTGAASKMTTEDLIGLIRGD
ncbi:MAG: DEAD/DEAH box helicase [Planctomycetota bacterium]